MAAVGVKRLTVQIRNVVQKIMLYYQRIGFSFNSWKQHIESCTLKLAIMMIVITRLYVRQCI